MRDKIKGRYLALRRTSELVRSIPYYFGIFGGAVRAWALNQQPRDIDIAIECNREQLADITRGRDIEYNRFGGIKINADGYDFDLWPLEDTWALKNESVEPTFENLASYASLNVDCIVLTSYFDLLDFGFSEALKSGFVEINYAPNPIAPANALRGLRLCKKLGLRPGRTLLDYVEQHVTDKNREVIGAKYQKVYGETVDDVWKIYLEEKKLVQHES